MHSCAPEGKAIIQAYYILTLVKAQPHRSLAMIGLSGISTYEIQIKINKKKVIPYLCCSIFTEQSSIHFTMDKLFFNLYLFEFSM
jgi:hypothetical protein